MEIATLFSKRSKSEEENVDDLKANENLDVNNVDADDDKTEADVSKSKDIDDGEVESDASESEEIDNNNDDLYGWRLMMKI